MGSKYANTKTILLITIIFVLLSVTCFPTFQSEEYYANLEIDVDNSGFVTIKGSTNHPDLIADNTELYTSKKQSFWLLNITKDEVFSGFVFLLTLPKNSEINYVTSTGSVNIGQELGSLVVKGIGENESFSLVVQYKTEKIIEDETIFGLDLFSIILMLTIIFLIILFFIVLFFIDRQKKVPSIEKTEDGLEINLKGLNDRQKKIIMLLLECKKAMTQTEIQRELNIPKAAVSRNIRGLELKGLIEKEQHGMSNLIRIKKP